MAGVNWKIDLAWLAERMGLLPAMTVCECSVGPLDISVAPGFVGMCDYLLLVEPIPYLADEASKVLKTKVLQVAVGMTPGKQVMIDQGGSSYLEGTWSPTKEDDTKTLVVDVVTFDMIDPGNIDILALDCEGQEWAVLSKMKSDPKLLTIEIWEGHPFSKEIYRWLKDHNYILRFATGPTSETLLYAKEGL